MPKRGPPPYTTRRAGPPKAAPNVQIAAGPLSGEQKTALRNAAVAAAATASIFSLSYLVLPKFFEFPTETLDQLVFVLRAEVFVFLWVVMAFRIVSGNRFFGSVTGDSPRLQAGEQRGATVQFAHNTLEQAVMALVVHLALATLLEGAAMTLIVGAIVLFVLGRATFLAGLRYGSDLRAIGMMITALPNMLCYFVALALLIGRALQFG